MWRNYFITAVRNMLRNRTSTLINMLGLTVGLAVFITISCWIRFERSYNLFHEHSGRIFLVRQTLHLSETEYTTDRVGGAFAAAIKNNYPAVSEAVRISNPQELVLSVPKTARSPGPDFRHFVEKQVLAVDSAFCKVFSFDLISGDESQFLKDPFSLYLTPKMGEKYFGSHNPVGRTIQIREQDFTVRGLIQEPPQNSSIKYDVLLPFDIMEHLGYPTEGFGGTMFYTYLLVDHPEVADRINASLPRYLNSLYDDGLDPHQFVVPLKKVHLYGESYNYVGIYLYSVIAILILLIACINFINLTTAQKYNRAGEVGLRKVNGARRKQLIFQFLGETFIIMVVATYLAVILAEFMVPVFGRIHGFELHLDFSNPAFWLQLVSILLIITLVAGFYPAYVLSSIRSASVLKNDLASGLSGSRLRKILVVTQFFFSVVLIISTIFALRQFRYMQTADLGFTRENVVYIPVRGKIPDNYQPLKNALLQDPDILSVSTGSYLPVHVDQGDIEWGDKPGKRNQIARILHCDQDFLHTFGIQLQEGRFFSENKPSDQTQSIVINQKTADMLRWEEPVGRDFYLWNHRYRVIGVTGNFRFFPYNMGGEALIIKYEPVSNFVFVRLLPEGKEAALETIRHSYERFNPGYALDYGFVSDYKFSGLEDTEKFNLLFAFLTFMGIFISCSGLFGLVLYSTNKRVREIGIRKAMGATAPQIQRLLIGDFVKWVVIANLLAIPVAWWIVERIFRFFAYRVDLSAWVFLLAVGITLLMTLLTVFYRSGRAAARNPVDSLRYE